MWSEGPLGSQLSISYSGIILILNDSVEKNMLTESDEAVLGKRIVEIHGGKRITDKELYDLLKNLVVEYSELFPVEGKVKSLEFIVDFIFIFIGEMHRDIQYHNQMLVYFCEEAIEEQLLTKRWQNSEEVAFRLLTYLALTSTYADGSKEIITAFDNWVSVSLVVIENEQKNGTEWNDLGRHFFIRLNNMYNHDLLFAPAILFWNSLIDQYGGFEVNEEVKAKLLDFLEYIEQKEAGNPSAIAEGFARLYQFTQRLDCERVNERMSEGIFRYRNM